MEEANAGYLLTIIAALITADILSLFIHLLDDPTIGTGALIGFLAGLIASLQELSPTFFENRHKTLFSISTGYHLISLTVMGMIIAALS